jgi:hypothetical protein
MNQEQEKKYNMEIGGKLNLVIAQPDYRLLTLVF